MAVAAAAAMPIPTGPVAVVVVVVVLPALPVLVVVLVPAVVGVVVVVVGGVLHGAILGRPVHAARRPRHTAVRPSPPVAALGAAALAAAVIAASVRLTAAVPPPRAVVHVPATLTLTGDPPPPVDLPGGGSLVLEAEAGGAPPARLAALAPEVVRPIGSVAKTMTALAVLDAHPLAAGEEGPLLTMTAEDVSFFERALAVDGSSLPVHAGERLSERALLLGLMLPSANNLAETLGTWVAGSHDAFVARMNAMAQRLGMTATHFEDPSGFSPQTVSTAADLLRLGRAALAVPTLARIVATTDAPFPDGTTLHNLDYLLSAVPGWLGIKTGETPSAGGCLLFAVRRPLTGAGTPVTLVGAVLGQPHLGGALDAARSAVESGYAGYTAQRVADLDPPLTGAVTAPWGDSAAVLLGAGEGDTLALRPGTRVALVAVAGPLPDQLTAGDTVARVEARSGTVVLARWRVIVSTGLGPAPVLWRLFGRR
jgi:D-alanyl-D-alanine carboxypeptidase (penicillin-binding protein 5/6)